MAVSTIDALYNGGSEKISATSTGVDITGGFAATDGSTITTADNTTQLSLISTDTDANTGPVLVLWRNSANPAGNDATGKIAFQGEDAGGNKTTYSNIETSISDPTEGSEDGKIDIRSILAGTEISRIEMGRLETVINEDSKDLDFRVESDGSTHALFVEGSSGNVGIGTSSPGQKLVVDGNIQLGTSSGAGKLYLSSSSGFSPRLQEASNALFIYTNNSARMRIDSGGQKIMNGNSTFAGIYGGTQSGCAFNDAGDLYSSRATGSNSIHVRWYNTNGLVGNIATNGSSTSYNTSSDYRLKTDAQPMTGASARVQALNPVNFEWLSDGSRVDGFLAHEAQAVVPEAVHGTKDAMMDEEYEVTPAVLDDDGNETTAAVMGTRSVPDYQGIDQSKLVPLLTAALQEALTKIDDMETRLATLEG